MQRNAFILFAITLGALMLQASGVYTLTHNLTHHCADHTGTDQVEQVSTDAHSGCSHSHHAPSPDQHGSDSEREQDSEHEESPAPHDEHSCDLCQMLGSLNVNVPEDSTEIRSVELAQGPELVAPLRRYEDGPTLHDAPARAPPIA